MGGDGCDWFHWAYNDLGKGVPQTLVQTSSLHLSRSGILVVELSPAQHGQLSFHRLPKKNALPTAYDCTLATNVSPSSPSQHCVLSIGLSEHFEPLTYAQHCNFIKKHGVSPIDKSQSSPTPCLEPPHDEGTSSSAWIWLFDFYVDKMDIGFKKCRLQSNKHCPVKNVFQDHFHVLFVQSSFYDHCHHWMSVSSWMCKQYIGYGHTECNCWSTFLHKEIRGKGQSRHL